MALTGDMGLRVARRRMVQEQLVRHGIHDARVLAVMGSVARHRFVDDVLANRAYGPNALPIGGGQTISHPRVVALMSQALRLEGHERVLEIGTGSGYQTAVLAHLAREVWTLERLPALARRATMRLAEMGFANVHVRAGAALEWAAEAPFDCILASAAAPEVPGRLLAQLGRDGRLVLPVGRGGRQQLLLLSRHGDEITTQSLGPCRFVPLLGPQAPRGAAGSLPGAIAATGPGAHGVPTPFAAGHAAGQENTQSV